MIRRPPRSTRTDTLFPDTTLFRSYGHIASGERASVAPPAITPLEVRDACSTATVVVQRVFGDGGVVDQVAALADRTLRLEEHTSELQSLMRISYAVFCLKKKNKHNKRTTSSNKL